MIVPGANLLNIAMSVIGKQTITLYRRTGRTQNARGDWVPTFAAGVPAEGSWQPVEAKKYAELGLDLKKKYYFFYSNEPISTAERDTGADIATRGGRKYEAIGETPWGDIDGWQATIFVDVGADA